MLSNFLFVLDGMAWYLLAGSVAFYLAAKLEASEREYLRRRRERA